MSTNEEYVVDTYMHQYFCTCLLYHCEPCEQYGISVLIPEALHMLSSYLQFIDVYPEMTFCSFKCNHECMINLPSVTE